MTENNANIKLENVYIGAYWRDRRQTAREVVQLCHGFLHRLADFSSAFDNRCVVPGVKPVILPPDYESFERIMAQALNNPDYVYENPDPRVKTFALDSTLSRGFRWAISDPSPLATRQTAIAISVNAGAYDTGRKYNPVNTVLIEIPPAHRDFWADRMKAAALMEIVVNTWRPAFGILTSSELRKALNPSRQPVDFSIGPLTYFADAVFGEAVNEFADVSHFSPAVGAAEGVLVMIDALEPWADHVDAFQPAYQRLSAANLLTWSGSVAG